MKRKISVLGLVCAAVLLGLLVAEAVYFSCFLSKQEPLRRADLIVVFSGAEPRIKSGYDLAKAGYAPCLVISAASALQVEAYKRRFKSESTKHIIEPNARTTFENAMHTKSIIEARECGSLILVTSWYHLPRSYFLLRLLLRGMDTRIQTWPVPSGAVGRIQLLKDSRSRKAIYREMVRFWASLIELLNFKVSGQLPETNPKDMAPAKCARRLLPFF